METTREEKKISEQRLNGIRQWQRSETMITRNKNTQKNSHAKLKSFGYYVNRVFFLACISSICRLFSLSFLVSLSFCSVFFFCLGFRTPLVQPFVCILSFIQHSLCWIIVSSAHDIKALHSTSQRVKFHTVFIWRYEVWTYHIERSQSLEFIWKFSTVFFFFCSSFFSFISIGHSIHHVPGIQYLHHLKVRLKRNDEFSCNSRFGARFKSLSMYNFKNIEPKNPFKLELKMNGWIYQRIFAMCICINMQTQLALVAAVACWFINEYFNMWVFSLFRWWARKAFHMDCRSSFVARFHLNEPDLYETTNTHLSCIMFRQFISSATIHDPHHTIWKMYWRVVTEHRRASEKVKRVWD